MPDPAPPDPQQVQSLYRRFRPQRFAGVLGQEHVTVPLHNAVRSGTVSHAYLFSGPRGTGKTSTARILAKALNCTDPDDGEPCDRCPSCVEITRGSSLDVHELDAASNNGVDAMRDLVARAALGTPGRTKVYIVDEVHMLSTAASNALLKTLEEPPSHVVFVLATTDPQKVLPTIRSRTQHFEFRLLGPDVLSELLRQVRDAADLGLDDGAVDLAVRRGRGSARDALSVLDQVAAGGVADDEGALLAELAGALGDQDPSRALVAVGRALGSGVDPQRLAGELADHLRQAFLATVAPELVTVADADRRRVEELAARMGLPGVVRGMERLGSAQVAMRDAPDPRAHLEVAVVRLTTPVLDDTVGALLERVERLERALSSGVPAGIGSGPATVAAHTVPSTDAGADAAASAARQHQQGAVGRPDAGSAGDSAPASAAAPAGGQVAARAGDAVDRPASSRAGIGAATSGVRPGGSGGTDAADAADAADGGAGAPAGARAAGSAGAGGAAAGGPGNEPAVGGPELARRTLGALRRRAAGGGDDQGTTSSGAVAPGQFPVGEQAQAPEPSAAAGAAGLPPGVGTELAAGGSPVGGASPSGGAPRSLGQDDSGVAASAGGMGGAIGPIGAPGGSGGSAGGDAGSPAGGSAGSVAGSAGLAGSGGSGGSSAGGSTGLGGGSTGSAGSADGSAGPAGPAARGALPTRDELVQAWGDHVLAALPGRARARFRVGRFVAADGDAAVFALPNETHRSYCEEVRRDVEDVLSAHFGVRVLLHLVVDDDREGSGPGLPGDAGAADPSRSGMQQGGLSPAEPDLSGTDDDDALLDPEVLRAETAPAGAGVSPEQRLRQAFPGAEEV
ncbi:MAG: DNA polymerase III subunit gamma/tau [Actinomycetota bacterium]|nr:DNA polymerase III subunit gamma/tau [Actinomycetota bacterium]